MSRLFEGGMKTTAAERIIDFRPAWDRRGRRFFAETRKLMLLEPVLLEKVWGGDRLARWFGGASAPAGTRVGEALLLHAHAGGSNRVASGPHAGGTLAEALAAEPERMLGGGAGGECPLICKLLHAGEGHLSVQVHPDASCAACGERAKEEAWYVIEALREEPVVAGLSTSAAEFLLGGARRRALRYLPAAPGDVFHIPSGAAHSLLAGTLVFEVSTVSETTLRLWDWDRRGRSVHPERAAKCIRPERTVAPVRGVEREDDDRAITAYELPFCRLLEVDLMGQWRLSRRGSFWFAAVLWGELDVEGTALGRGAALFLPAEDECVIRAVSPARLLVVIPR